MNRKDKFRLLIIIVLTLLLVIGIVTKNLFVIPFERQESSPTPTPVFSIEDLRIAGEEPAIKISRLSALLHERYPGIVAIAGKFGVNQVTDTTYVAYEVILILPLPTTSAEIKSVEETKNLILSELVIGTIKLFSVETNIPNVGSNTLHDLMLIVTAIYVDKTGSNLDSKSWKMAYLFSADNIKALFEDFEEGKATTADWSKYVVPIPHTPSLPNTGQVITIEIEPEPVIPND